MSDTQHTRPFQRQMVTSHTLYPQPTADHALHRYRINSFEQTTDPSGDISQALNSGHSPYGIFMKEKNRIITRKYESPCGTLMLGSFGDKLCLCDWQVEKHRDHVDNRLRRLLDAEFLDGPSAVIDTAIAQLDEYFAGTRQEFNVPILFAGTDYWFPEKCLGRRTRSGLSVTDYRIAKILFFRFNLLHIQPRLHQITNILLWWIAWTTTDYNSWYERCPQ